MQTLIHFRRRHGMEHPHSPAKGRKQLQELPVALKRCAEAWPRERSNPGTWSGSSVAVPRPGLKRTAPSPMVSSTPIACNTGETDVKRVWQTLRGMAIQVQRVSEQFFHSRVKAS